METLSDLSYTMASHKWIRHKQRRGTNINLEDKTEKEIIEKLKKL